MFSTSSELNNTSNALQNITAAKDGQALYEAMIPPQDHSSRRQYFRAARTHFFSMNNPDALADSLDGYHWYKLIEFEDKKHLFKSGPLKRYVQQNASYHQKYSAAQALMDFINKVPPFTKQSNHDFFWVKNQLLLMNVCRASLTEIVNCQSWFKNQYLELIKADSDLNTILNLPNASPSEASLPDSLFAVIARGEEEDDPPAPGSRIFEIDVDTTYRDDSQLPPLATSTPIPRSRSSSVADGDHHSIISHDSSIGDSEEEVRPASPSSNRALVPPETSRLVEERITQFQQSARRYLAARSFSVWLIENHCGWLVKLVSPLRYRKIELVREFLKKLPTEVKSISSEQFATIEKKLDEDKNVLDEDMRAAVQDLKRIDKNSIRQKLDEGSQYEKAFSQKV